MVDEILVSMHNMCCYAENCECEEELYGDDCSVWMQYDIATSTYLEDFESIDDVPRRGCFDAEPAHSWFIAADHFS